MVRLAHMPSPEVTVVRLVHLPSPEMTVVHLVHLPSPEVTLVCLVQLPSPAAMVKQSYGTFVTKNISISLQMYNSNQ